MSRMHTIPNSWLDAAAIRLALCAAELRREDERELEARVRARLRVIRDEQIRRHDAQHGRA